MRRIDPEIEQQTKELYKDPERKLSMDQVGKWVGICATSVRNVLIRNNEPTRSVGNTEKYPKTDFSGDLAEQARIIGFIEDCSARHHARQIHVQTTTTHPAQIKLFYDIFEGYGHIGRTPRYHKRHLTYQWNVYVYLNDTFDFLPEYKKNRVGLLAEIAENGYPRAILSIGNKNRQLLERTQKTIGGDIYRSNDCYQLRLFYEDAVEALRKLPLMHEEKVAAKELILYYADNGGIGIEPFKTYQGLRRRIDEEAQLCTLQARLEFIRKHGKPHRYDRDQTVPKNLTLSSSFSFV